MMVIAELPNKKLRFCLFTFLLLRFMTTKEKEADKREGSFIDVFSAQ